MPPLFHQNFTNLLAARGLTVRRFAELAGVSSSFVQLVRSARRPPPLERIAGWVKIIQMSPAEECAFIESALLAHAPPEVAALVFSLRREVVDLKLRVTELEGILAVLRDKAQSGTAE